MSESTTSRAEPDRGEPESWPWRCLYCRTTIYHDGERCRDCRSSRRPAGRRPAPDAPDGFADWVREQTAPALVLKVTAIAGIELSLTALWLRVVSRGHLLGGALPVI